MSDVHQSLGLLGKEFVDPEDLALAVFKVFAFRGLETQQSVNRVEASKPINLVSRDTVISIPDLMFVSYLEQKVGNPPNDEYDWIPIVRPSRLETDRKRGFASCTFDKLGSQLHLRLSYLPTGAGQPHRIRYYKNPTVPGTIQDPLPIPPRFVPMLSAEAVIIVVPMVLGKSAQLSEDKQLNSAQLKAIEAAVALAERLIEQWQPLWDRETTGDRNARGRMRRPLVPRGY